MVNKVLLELNLTKPNSRRDKTRPPRAIDVLQYLLEKQEISEEQIRKAHDAVSATDAEIRGERDAKEDAPEKSLPQKSIRRRHIALKFSYDGRGYSGLAENVGSEKDQSIERSLFAALKKAHLIESRESCGYSRCGRTDRGVSSAGQVVGLWVKSAFSNSVSINQDGTGTLDATDLPRNSQDQRLLWVVPRKPNKPRQQREIREYSYDTILNNLLPPDIRVLGWTPVSDEFSARFSASDRTYRYFFLKKDLDLDAMKAALDLLVGSHDFRNFCKMDVEKVYNFERKIRIATIVEEDDDVCFFLIVGQAFLWHQIRCIASILFYIGQDLESPSLVTELLDADKNPGKPAYPLADELPLVLHNCGYPNLDFGFSAENLWYVVCHYESQHEDLVLSAARIRNNISSLRNANVSVQQVVGFFQSKLTERNKRLEQAFSPQAKSWKDPPFADEEYVAWGRVVDWLKETYGMMPESANVGLSTHVPVMRRHRGTTYDEKVQSLQKSSKRSQRYETNVIKKRKTKEEDAAFYKHMAAQGGTAK